MDKGILNIEICNTADTKQDVDLFNIGSLDGQGEVSQPEEIVTGDNSGELISLGANRSYVGASALDKDNNVLYTYTPSSGIRVYNIFTRQSSNITTATPVNGNALPNDTIGAIFWNPQNGYIYVSNLSNNIWVYDPATNTGSLIADQMINNPAFLFVYNDIIYTGNNGSGGDYVIKLEAGVKTNLSNPANGDSMADQMGMAYLHIATNTLYFSTYGDGFYSLNLTTDTGKHHLTTTPVNGDALPSNTTKWLLSAYGDNVFISTNAGIYIYNVATDTGTVINTGTSMSGDSLPTNIISFTDYNDYDNKLYVSGESSFFLWRYEIATNTGEVIGSVTSGTPRPNFISYQIFIYGSLIELSTTSMWRWDENILQPEIEGNTISIKSDSSDDISYEYIVHGVQQSPIEITKIIFTCNNSLQKYNSLTKLIDTILGVEVTYTISFADYVNPLLPFKQIHVELEEPFIIDFENFLQLPIEANTCVQLLFEYSQISPAKLMEHLAPEKKDILPIFYDEYKKTGIIDNSFNTEKEHIIGSMIKPEFKWLPPWLVLAFFIIYLKIKDKQSV